MDWKVYKHYFAKFIVVLITMLPFCLPAQHFSTEDKLKAAFIFNFTRLAAWPQSEKTKDADSINVCSFSNSNINSFLKHYQNKRSKGKTVNIKIIEPQFSEDKIHQTATKAQQCDLLFIGKEIDAPITFTQQLSETKGLLLVSDKLNFAQCAGHIEFTHNDSNKLSLIINKLNFINSKLKISSRVLIRSQLLSSKECPE